MRKTVFATVIYLLAASFLQAQTALPDSRRSSAEYHIYTVNRDNLRKIYLKDVSITEHMLGDLVTKFSERKELDDDLPRGNYLIVNAIENRLNISDYTVDDLYFKIVPSEKVMLCLYDSLGRIITGAVVKCGSKKLKYDKETRTYQTGSLKDEQIIEVNNRGVYHYIEVEKRDSHYTARKATVFKALWWRQAWLKLKRQVRYVFYPSTRSSYNKYTGFVVFSKPRYKPGETVKLKAHMEKLNGTPYAKPVDLRLYSYYPVRMDTVLVSGLTPYRPGMYEYQFTLTDSLGLKLDSRYTVGLRAKGKRYGEVSSHFTYEEYELKSIRFSVSADKKVYARNDSVKILLKASDENDMAVYDGQVEVLVLPENMTHDRSGQHSFIFMPDTLWTHTVDMSGVSEKEVTLPDSIFPPGASFFYRVNCTYLSVDNEKRNETKRLFRKADDHTLDFNLSNGMLTVQQLHEGQSQEVKAEITTYGENSETLSVEFVTLPHTQPVPWIAEKVTVKTANAEDFYLFDAVKSSEQLGYKFYRANDSVYLKVDSPARIPFWYIIRQGKKEIASGQDTHLDYAVKEKGQKGYGMQLSYLFAGESKRVEQSLPFVQKNLSLEVSTPTSVYPGQKTQVSVEVTDRKGKPVEKADVTAYSFTSKFGNYSIPSSVQVKGKGRQAKRFERVRYTPDEAAIDNKKSGLTWDVWKTGMALDTIAYYNFLYPETYYKYTEPTPDGSTQLLPYVVIDGALQKVHMLWIDGVLHYSSLAQQLDVYAFQVIPGKHNLTIRTYDREVSVRNLPVEKRCRNIYSFRADKAYAEIGSGHDSIPFVVTSRLLSKKEWGRLTDKETDYLSSQLITVDSSLDRLELPGLRETLDLPVYIRSGNTFYYLNQVPRISYNYALRAQVSSPVLAGPFPVRNFMNGLSDMASLYNGNRLVTNFQLEGGSRYTLYDNYQKIKNWDELPFRRVLLNYSPVADFKKQPLTPKDIREMFNRKLHERLSASWGTTGASGTIRPENKSRLNLYLGKDREGLPIKPSLIFIVPGKKEELSNHHLYYGGTRDFKDLPAGRVVLSLIFNDSTTYSKTVTLRPNGNNYLSIDSIIYEHDDSLAKNVFALFNRRVKRAFARNPYVSGSSRKDSIMNMPVRDIELYSQSNAQEGVVTGIVVDDSGEPLLGAAVTISGTQTGTVTGLDGRFKLAGVDSGGKLSVAYIGYRTRIVNYKKGHDYKIVLEGDYQALEEVVVVGYGTVKKSSVTGSLVSVTNESLAMSDNQVLQGRVAGLMIRGASTAESSGPPLILVNGLPFDGKLEDIDPSVIADISILKDASATAIYGSRAANGVVMIQANTAQAKRASGEEQTGDAPGNSMRRNFHDDAFWQPKLTTDKQGKASFEVTYPDDITSWKACFIAVGDKNQTDKKELTIRSFKALTARLSTPRFAIRGDSLNAVGRIANHYGDSVQVERKVETGRHIRQEKLKLASSHTDHIPVRAEQGDSLTLAYSLEMQNGYFDGEERSIPILEQGMLQTYGSFRVISDSLLHRLETFSGLGSVTVHAEASGVESLLREIDKVDKYPYLCNEQMASKIKALLSQKRVMHVLGKKFDNDKKINNLIGRLNKNRNPEGLWGWWNRGRTESWISRQVISAMLDAGKAGYKTDFDSLAVSGTLERELKNALSALRTTRPGPDDFPQAKQELLDHLICLKRIGAVVNYKGYFREIDAVLKSRTTADKLKTMHALSVIGLESEIQMDSLMRLAHRTLLGSLYWGDAADRNIYPRHFILPYESNTEYTLAAYSILKSAGGYDKELAQIRNYFFECRQDGSWQNIYEASRIIETILPDMLADGEQYSRLTAYINGKKVSEFPYTGTLDSAGSVEVKKEGTPPLFITAYQQAWNKKPETESAKGFAIRSYFVANNDTVSHLTAGKVARLEVTVHVDGDADYVQIEVPIPAGCSYETKGRGNYRNEVHREHFKEKVVIFSNKLRKGEHQFSIDLIPRYTGMYCLNPAKVELMYFPTCYGNERVKSVGIK